jgi:putative FmdB family regulatory protein|tara:strand:+ start:184 stop:477 length:294 start_codon:yes stop_codon:yes gene_type:complete
MNPLEIDTHHRQLGTHSVYFPQNDGWSLTLMPVYEYRCFECGAQFERRLPFSKADAKLPCPTCGKAHAEKMLSTFALGSQSSTSAHRATRTPRSGFT